MVSKHKINKKIIHIAPVICTASTQIDALSMKNMAN